MLRARRDPAPSELRLRLQEKKAKEAIQNFFYLVQLEKLRIAIERDRACLRQYTVSPEASAILSLLFYKKIQPLSFHIKTVFEIELPIPSLNNHDVFDATIFLNDVSAKIQSILIEKMNAIFSSDISLLESCKEERLFRVTRNYLASMSPEATPFYLVSLKNTLLQELDLSDNDNNKALTMINIFFELLSKNEAALRGDNLGLDIRHNVKVGILRLYLHIHSIFQEKCHDLKAHIDFPQYSYWEHHYQYFDLKKELEQCNRSVAKKATGPLSTLTEQGFFARQALIRISQLTLPIPATALSQNSVGVVISSDPINHTIEASLKALHQSREYSSLGKI